MSESTPLQPQYWSTLSEFHRDEEYQARLGEEFHPDAKPERFFDAARKDEALLTPMHRRTFLKLSAFAAVAGAVSACERPVQKILPYVHKPENMVLGVADYYASTCSECAAGCGLLVKTREGRPVKLEGNPDHPLNRGSLCTKGQASILSLYNPDRLKFPVQLGRKGNQEYSANFKISDADGLVSGWLTNATGKVVLLTPTVHGLANTKLIQDFGKSVGNFEHVVYDALESGLTAAAIAQTIGSKTPVTPRYAWDRADVIVSFGGDPLAQGWSLNEAQRNIGLKRHPEAEGGMSRLYVFEPAPTLTGSKADYRYIVHPSQLLAATLAVAAAVISEGPLAGNGALKSFLAEYSADKAGVSQKEIDRVAASLKAAAGRSIVTCDGAAASTADAASLHLAVAILNAALGNFGKTIDVSGSSNQAQGSTAALAKLVTELNAGEVEVLILNGVNPVYTLPASAGFKEALAKAKHVVSLGMWVDETSSLADVAVPGVHGLEAWGDAEPLKGLYSLQQPVINTLFGPDAADASYSTRSWQESLIAFATAAGKDTFQRELTTAELEAKAKAKGLDAVAKLEAADKAPRLLSYYDFLRETWRDQLFAGSGSKLDFDTFWNEALRLGVVDTTAEQRAAEAEAPEFAAAAVAGLKAPAAKGGLVLVLQPTANHGDGYTMHNPHMLELPDPITKISWENFVSIAPTRAKELGVKDGDFVKLTVGGKSVEGPALVQPGIHKDVVAVNLGWGRATNGGIGDGIGINGFPLAQTAEGGETIFSGLDVKIEKASGSTDLANVQGHQYLYSPSFLGMMANERKGEVPEGATRDSKTGKAVFERPIVAETTLNEWKASPTSAYPNHTAQGTQPETIWERKHVYVGNHWGMAIDLNTCIGCNACMVACSIENNVPVVGKVEIVRGREMHWIRIDRYYRGTEENPDFVFQPMLCQHCGNAPCETVCPVVATMHNDEGLNVMVYNRCVGTRYCANNCPYKVRRFNFWQYSDYRTGPQENIKRVSPLELVLNPDVTTRTRGVMEKCTFCIHRTRTAKEKARVAGHPVKDGDMVTACQQTCPTKAITFGDRNDPEAQVTKLWQDPRAYRVLEDLNTDPGIQYLALVRNRDEASPYRTMYQDHRLHEEHSGHGGSHGSKHSTGAGAHGEAAPANAHEPAAGAHEAPTSHH